MQPKSNTSFKQRHPRVTQNSGQLNRTRYFLGSELYLYVWNHSFPTIPHFESATRYMFLLKKMCSWTCKYSSKVDQLLKNLLKMKVRVCELLMTSATSRRINEVHSVRFTLKIKCIYNQKPKLGEYGYHFISK